MIDISKAKEAFERFMSNYDMNNEKIKLKYHHTNRVMDVCRNIALSEGFNDEEVALAELIGLLHDIGRFEQIKRYGTYSDIKTNIDHGVLGTSILFNDNMIREFIEDNKYDEIIKKALYAHNKAIVPNDYSDIENTYTNLVRDADKIDILYILASKEIKYDVSDESISSDIIDNVNRKTFVDCHSIKTDLDAMIYNLSYVYDLNFDSSYRILREKNYVNKIIDLYNFKNEENVKIFEYFKESLNNELNKCEEVI